MTILSVFLGFLAIYFLTTITLYAFAPQSRTASFYARFLASWAALLICACYGVLSSGALRIVGYGGLGQWTTARAFKWTMWYFAGVEFVVQGEEHLKTRPAIFLSNHQTELDVLMLGAVFPRYCSVTAKKNLKWVPFLGWFMALSKTVFIDRGNRKDAMAAFDSAAQQMRTERQSVFIFPEGTRSYTAKPEMLPFKKGAFHLAVKAQVPIVPIVVANYSNILHLQKRKFTGGKIPLKGGSPKPCTNRQVANKGTKVLPPIDTKGLTAKDVDELTKRTRDIMLEELIRLSELARAQKVSMSSSDAAKANGTATQTSSSNGAAEQKTQPVAAT
ncbi:MAG: 1-acylglycerol-3-phosphate O-acyltransferase [Bogoriella megaspora]|nr:MAG: 1-acylglycerol-3-phosphate O-acyltransferase [Bogoriella megaspora]